jgi:hypothetical protein
MNDYRVRGTVRSSEKGEYLKKLFDGVGEFEYVIVEDIAKVSSSDRAKYVMLRSSCSERVTDYPVLMLDCHSLALSTKPSRASMELVSPAPHLPTHLRPMCLTFAPIFAYFCIRQLIQPLRKPSTSNRSPAFTYTLILNATTILSFSGSRRAASTWTPRRRTS